MSVLEAIGLTTVIVGSGLLTYALGAVFASSVPDSPAGQRTIESRLAGAVLVMIVMTLLFVTGVL